MANEVDRDEWEKFGVTLAIVTAGGIIWIVKQFVAYLLGVPTHVPENLPSKKVLGVNIVDDIVKE